MKRSLIAPLIITALVIPATELFLWYYWDSGWYTGGANAARPGNIFDITSVVFVLGLCFFVKYFIYDYCCRRIISRDDARVKVVAFILFYILALMIDFGALFNATAPIADAGFAAIAIVFYSPPLLLAGIGVVWASGVKRPNRV